MAVFGQGAEQYEGQSTGTEFAEGRCRFINMVWYSLSMAKVCKIANVVSKANNNQKKWEFHGDFTCREISLWLTKGKRNVNLNKAKVYPTKQGLNKSW